MKVYVTITYDRMHRHVAPDIIERAIAMMEPILDSTGVGATMEKEMIARHVLQQIRDALKVAREEDVG
jgi:hypothetical protein